MRHLTYRFLGLCLILALLAQATLPLPTAEAKPDERPIPSQTDQLGGSQPPGRSVGEIGPTDPPNLFETGQSYDPAVAQAAIAAAERSLAATPDDEPAGINWRQCSPVSHPSARWGHAMAYDSARGVVVLFDGMISTGYRDDTWEWDGTNWVQRSPASHPSVRGEHAMAYDSARGVVVLFGGYNHNYSPRFKDDTWEWDGTNWAQRSPANHPSARGYHAMAYDGARGVVVLFGGSASGGYVDDTWEWDGTNWVQRTPVAHPSARSLYAMAYDSARGVVVLFGGSASGSYLDDTWEWDGTNWVQRSPANHPSARWGHAMAYDSARGVVVLFGGYDGSSRLDDTWEWHGTDWVQRSPVSHPSARSSHAMAYDSARGVTVFFGGAYDNYNSLSDTWEFGPPLLAPALSPISNPDGDGDYQVAWSAVAEAITYSLEEDDHLSFPSPIVRYQGDQTAYQVSGQGSGDWYYRVKASNAEGDSYWSNIEATHVRPGAPTLYAIDNGDGDRAFLVDWSDASGAISYTLEEDDQPGFASPSVRYSGPATEYQVTGQPGGTWHYRVRASNAGGDSPWSNTESTIVILDSPDLSPIDNADGDGNYVVAWSSEQDASGYTLEEDNTPDFSSPSVRYQGTGTQYQVLGQYAGTWYYRVRAFNAAGNSPWSNTESASVLPAAPTLYPIDNPGGNNSYLVDWSSVQGATGYTLEEDDNAGFSSPSVRYQGTGSQFLVTGPEGGTWYYRARASNGGGNGPWSNVEATTVKPDAPFLYPIGNSDGDGDYLVDWTVPQGAGAYTLQEDDNSSFTSPTTVYEGADSVYVVAGQPVGTWYYRARAGNGGGDSDWSNVEGANVAPAAPVLQAISNPDGDGHYLLDWNDVTGATAYTLQEDDNAGFSSPTERYAGVDSQYQITAQQAGTWYYRVKASNLGGDSPWSNTELVSVIPAAPVLASISNPDGDGDYLLDWNDVTGASGYVLQEDDNAGFSSPTERYSGVNSQYQVTGQGAGTWYYRVKASNLGGDGPWSNTRSVGVDEPPIAAPALAPISNLEGDGSYLVDWSDVVAATGYTLEEDDSFAFVSPTVRYTGPASHYQVTGQPGGTWYYRVRASSAGGDGPWSNIESASVIPAAPVLAPISNPDGDGGYLVDWSDLPGASFTLQEDDNVALTSPVVRYMGTAGQYQVGGQEGGTWYYRVRASNAAGDSPWSNVESASVLPAAPVLLPIDNADGNGSYRVDWSETGGATGYALQEDDNAGFVSPTNRYQGMNTRYDVTHQDVGTWFYRVRASNAAGNSPWSAARAATVTVPPGPRQVYLPLVVRGFFYDPTEPNDTFDQAWGPLASGPTYRAYFPNESDNSDFYYLEMPAAHSIEIWLTNIPADNDYALYLYDAAHALVPGGFSDNYGNADEHISLPTMSAGRYYVRIERVIGTSRTQPYALRAVFE